MTFKNIVQLGASGALGTPVLNGLLTTGKFNITVLSRPSSGAMFPDEVSKIIKASYNDKAALVAFTGQCLVLITFGSSGEPLEVVEHTQKVILDAAIEAGVPYHSILFRS